jgi:carbohydrate kinase (thermoresistant glucokinase family)
MGVSGSGKSTVGRLLASRLIWPFYDGDDLHAPDMIVKMSRGTPLTDQDREAWLDRISALVAELDQEARSGVIACSALKKVYRERIVGNSRSVRFVFLKGSYELISERVEKRKQHFMEARLLWSQFEILEEPEEALTIDVSADPQEIVDRIRQELEV